MSYTIISEGPHAPSATVVDSVLDALKLARHEVEKTGQDVVIAADNGWILTLDELENMVHQ